MEKLDDASGFTKVQAGPHSLLRIISIDLEVEGDGASIGQYGADLTHVVAAAWASCRAASLVKWW